MVSTLAYDLMVAIVCSALFALIVFLVLVIIFKKRSVKFKPEENISISIRPCAYMYHLTDIDAATDGFNHRCVLGRGRLGTVYGAVLATGDAVIVKRIHPHLVLSNAGSSFSSVIRSLSLLAHPHVVPIVGYSEAPGERIIMMELMGMKSLDFHLHQNSEASTTLLDWGRRIRIAAGAARGLEYLHEGTAPSVVHGSIKPSNILIDLNLDARISDYGLSFLAPQDWGGLVGYLDPEYWIEKGGVCKASDVYAFGVVLLELLSGRSCDEGMIVQWALPLIKKSRVVEVLDPILVKPLDMKPLARLAKVASACVSNTRKNRPSIAQVATILNNLQL
ncbi:serine/threonine-protein kinase-like protein ACR4 [Magnolia sinica]|uniref:serine/threonine-protein kinase-like protein ACR4 n=1 Tax=Magnolia sinica TaxID=86752 RepID=UPI002657E853|nr:serine/threonine-protein kinase-like protein ACR4 [Magnolia sinica]